MPRHISIGDEAPNFDLTSTEDVVLMLRDEVPRSAVVLYFFGSAADERVRRDLRALADRSAALARRHAQVLGISPAKLDGLKALQRELGLPFPLLHDDRGFSRAYGLQPAAEGEEVDPRLVVVGRRQQVLWLADPPAVSAALPEVEKVLRAEPRPTAGYPRSVINRLIDRWVNPSG